MTLIMIITLKFLSKSSRVQNQRKIYKYNLQLSKKAYTKGLSKPMQQAIVPRCSQRALRPHGLNSSDLNAQTKKLHICTY